MKLIGFCRIALLLAFISLSPQLLAARELTSNEKKVISDAVKEKLIESDSASFKWLEITEKQPQVYCGVVNSTDVFDKHVSDMPYEAALVWDKSLLREATIILIGDADWSSIITKAILRACSQKGYNLAH
jgi:hypothetical protein